MSLSEKQKMFNIPYELCRFIVHKGIFTQASVFFALKWKCDGAICIDYPLRKILSAELEMHVVTVDRALKWLEKNSWIRRVNGNIFQVKAFNKLYFLVRSGNSTLGILWDPPQFKKTKAFCIAACAQKLLIANQRFQKRVSKSNKNKDTQRFVAKWQKEVIASAAVNSFDFDKGYIAKSYFAVHMDISETTAWEYLNFASTSEYLKSTRNYIKASFPAEIVRIARRHFSDAITRRTIILQGEAMIVLPNSYRSNLLIRFKNKIKWMEKNLADDKIRLRK